MNLIKLATESDFQGWRHQIRPFLEQRIPFSKLNFTIETSDQLYKSNYRSKLSENTSFFSISRQISHLIVAVFSSGSPDRFKLLYNLLERLRDNEEINEKEDPLFSRLIAISHNAKKDALLLREKLCSVPISQKAVLSLDMETALLDSQAYALFSLRPDNWLIKNRDRILCAHDNTLFFAPSPPDSAESNEDELFAFARTHGIPRHESPFWRSIMPFPVKPTPDYIEKIPSLPLLKAYATDCQLCPLCRAANRTVTGEGNYDASLMFVGEQPGDQEDLQGRPFVGPAGQLFDQALEECGIDRKKSWVTNAVKHFRFTPYGNGKRLHQKPDMEHIKACAPWLKRERDLLKPKVTVMMGVTGGTAILGRPITVSRERSKFLTLQDGSIGLVTVHPSFLLRQSDDSRAREYDHFVADLKLAYSALS